MYLAFSTKVSTRGVVVMMDHKVTVEERGWMERISDGLIELKE
jgi:hypothetical protein